MNRQMSIVALVCLGYAVAASALTVNVDPSATGRTFTGIGGISGGGATSRLLVSYPEPLRSQLLDVLFKPGAGANLQILKVEIGGDAQSTDGSEASHMHSADDLNYHRGYEWWLMTEAKKRNPDIKLYGLPWAFPAWVGGASRSPYDEPLLTSSYIVKWVQGAKSVYGLDIDYVGIWNERPYNAGYIIILRRALDDAGFTNTKIVAPDGTWGIADEILVNKTLADAVYAIGAHYPGTTTTAQALETGKPLWASEDMSTYNDLRGAGCWARILNQNHVNGNMTTTISWNIIASYYHGLPWYGTGILTATEPWSGSWTTENRNLGLIYGSAHTTYFTEAGWKYLQGNSGTGWLEDGGSYVTLTDGDDLTIVVEKMAWAHSQCIRPTVNEFSTSTETVTFNLPAAWATHTVYAWQTQFGWEGMQQGESSFMQFKGKVPVAKDGSFSWTIDVDSMYTFTTVDKPPLAPLPGSSASQPFPTVYEDNFDSYNISSEAKYFADQAGVWEIYQAADATHGRVMRQTVPTRPICWSGDYSPYSVIGDTTWEQADITADVLIESGAPGAVFVAAQLRPCCTPNGLFFGIAPATSGANASSAHWFAATNLEFGSSVIASGKVDVALDTWYTLRLVVTDDTMTGYVNGEMVLNSLSVESGSGWAGIGTGLVAGGGAAEGQAPAALYVQAQFDNFKLAKASTQTCTAPKAGDEVVMAWCDDSYAANNEWVLPDLNKGGPIKMKNSSPELCIEAQVGSSKATMQPCSGDASQQFTFQNSTYQPWVTVTSTAGLLSSSDTPGTTVGVSSGGGLCAAACSVHDPTLQWTFTGSATSPGLLKNSNGECVIGACTQISANGCEPLQMGTCDASSADQLFTHSAAGEFISHSNGGCLDLWGTTGPAVGLYRCHNGTNQRWSVDAATGLITNGENLQDNCLAGACALWTNYFMLNESGAGHITMYGSFVTDHCVAAGCPASDL